MNFQKGLDFAIQQDNTDPLKLYRDRFHMPVKSDGNEHIYLCGNSLGLMPKSTQYYINQELQDWAKYGVDGHLEAKNPWVSYHELLTDKMAKIVGAKPIEVVVMNSLTVNIHLLMVSFYRPTAKKFKILMEYSPFPSDRYAFESQVRFHGYEPTEAIIEMMPRTGEKIIHTEDIIKKIEDHGDEIALVLFGGVNYYTGQAYNIKEITEAGHRNDCVVGFDLAHAAGNLKLNLHEDGPDFAAWCSYKYINSGPGSLAGAFVHERHANNTSLPRFHGWWGHDKKERFLMKDEFKPLAGAEGWQMSNPPILSMAAINASLDVFDEVGMDVLRDKSIKLTGYLEYLVNEIDTDSIKIITPADPKQRGCQLSLQVIGADKNLYNAITEDGVIADWREPDVIRIAPAPLYNSFQDVYHFVRILENRL
jgi:kynureninase